MATKRTEKDQSGIMRTHDVLKEAMVTRRALRFYEQQGLLISVGRDRHGQRLYTRPELMRLKLIRALRNAGLSLAAIRQVLDARVKRSEDGAGDAWLHRMENVLSHHSDELQAQLQVVQQGERELREAVVWLREHHDAVATDPGQFIEGDAAPLLICALLCQSSSVPTEAPAQTKAQQKKGQGRDPDHAPTLGLGPGAWPGA
jgi:DNA-binding transcriptional MerR regulator